MVRKIYWRGVMNSDEVLQEVMLKSAQISAPIDQDGRFDRIPTGTEATRVFIGGFLRYHSEAIDTGFVLARSA